jgi:glycerophosphoryl diester phosphodiesterase
MAARPLVLAHRGASRQAPENTVAAFARARALGADGVELDVRRSADGVLIVHHDAIADPVGPLVEQPFAAIRAARPAIPTLAEALDACAGMLVNVEVKCLPWEADADPEQVVARAAVDLIRERDAHVVVSSFDLGTVDAVRAYAPELRTGFLVHQLDLPVAAALALEHGHAWLHPDVTSTLADLDSVALAHELGLQVDVWTVDDPAQLRTLAEAGVDAIITNAPDVALAALD